MKTHIKKKTRISNKDKIRVKFIEYSGDFILGSSSSKSQGEVTPLK